MVVVIEKDHISEPERGDTPRVGWRIYYHPRSAYEQVVMSVIGEEEKQLPDGLDGFPAIPFRMYDDDGELYYEGQLSDDPDCANQSAALRFGESDAGCTRIEVLRDGEWKQEIG